MCKVPRICEVVLANLINKIDNIVGFNPKKPGYLSTGQKLGRWLAKHYPEKSDAWIDAYRNAIFARVWPDNSLKFTIYDDVRRIYEDTVISSCMTGREARKMDWLTVTDNCRVLIVTQDGKQIARALIWNTRCGHQILDRLYSRKGMDSVRKNMIHKWAFEKNMVVRISSEKLIDKEGTTRGLFAVDMPEREECFPYLDTFSWGAEQDNGNWILYSKNVQKDNVVVFNETNGGHSECRGCGFECYACGDEVSEDEVYYSDTTNEYYCESCYRELHAECYGCCNFEWRDDMLEERDYQGYVNHYCSDCYEENFSECECCNNNTHNDCLQNDIDGKSVCEDCVGEHYTLTDHENELVLDEKVVTLDSYSFHEKNTREALQFLADEHHKDIIVCRKTVLVHCDELTCTPKTFGVATPVPAKPDWYSVSLNPDDIDYALN